MRIVLMFMTTVIACVAPAVHSIKYGELSPAMLPLGSYAENWLAYLSAFGRLSVHA